MEDWIAGAETSRKWVYVPAFDQVHSGRSLIEQLEQIVRANLILHSCVPIHHVTGMKVGIHPIGASRAVIGTHISGRTVRRDVILDRRGTLAELKKRPWISGRAL